MARYNNVFNTLSIDKQIELLCNQSVPNKTESYTPVANADILNEFEKNFTRAGYKATPTDFRVNKSLNQVIGYYDVATNDDPEIGFRIGFKNSYDKSMSFGVAMGGVVFICSNGMVSGEVSERRVHTGNADVDVISKIQYAFEHMEDEMKRNIELKKRLKETPVSERDFHTIMGSLWVNGNVLNETQLKKMRKECYESDKFATIKSGNFTAWDFYNAGTEAAKASRPVRFWRDHIELTKTFTNHYGIELVK